MEPQDPTAPAPPAAAAPARPAAQPSLFAASATQPTIPAQVIDEIAAARRAAQDEATARKALESQLEELKATVAKANEQVGLSAKQNADLAAARRAESIRNAAAMAAVKHGAVSESQLVKLVLDELDEVDGRVVAKADPKVSADDHIASFLKSNPHLARARVAQGSGASPFPAAAPAAGKSPSFREDPNGWLQAQLAAAATASTTKP